MSIARLAGTRESVAGIFPERVEAAMEGVDVRMDIHDASRLEWSVSLPLPIGAPCQYSIAVEMDIPSNAFARHTPWDQLQSFTRLDGGEAFKFDEHILTIDALRRNAVAIANQMARVGEGFARRCLVAASLFTRVASKDLEQELTAALDVAIALAEDARTKLVSAQHADATELARERFLVDEYVSVRLLALLAGAERGLGVLEESRAPHARELVGTISQVESRIADALEVELAYRGARGYICADPASHATLEAYLDRASRLKKHFQEVLFLEAEVFQVAERLHHWVAGIGALVASTWAFAWQIALMKHSVASSSTVGSGIIMVAIVAGIIYATKDRLKEVGRTWISGNVHRFYAQRVARYRAPARRLPGRDVVVTARESFEQRLIRTPDPLNPESGSLVPSTLIRYSQKGKVLPTPGLALAGVKRVKHVFRYDLSPLFARLDDAVKQIPVLDKSTHRVRFTEAPRSYRFPIRIRVACDGQAHEECAVVVLHKGGLDRLERVRDDLL
jgi:hypothetical protein